MRIRAIAGCVCAVLLGGCGDDDGQAVTDAAVVPDAMVVVDAAPIDGAPLTGSQPGDPFVLSADNAAGQDEDPAILRANDGSLFAVWYSNRNGTQADGLEDKEIFLARVTDAITWDEPPIQVTRQDDWAFFPSLAQDAAGAFHLAYWRVKPIPDGCTPGVDCTGTDNSIAYKSSADGLTWDLDAADTVIADGPGDWLPSVVYDAIGDRVLVYFSAVVRDANGDTDFGDTTARVYVVIRDSGGSWSGPRRVAGVNPDTSHNSYPQVVQQSNGTFLMAWTRYDVAASSSPVQVIQEESTDTMLATSIDGVNWTTPVLLSDGTGTFTDVFPHIHSNHAGTAWSVTWLSATLASATTVELPVGGTYPDDVIDRPNLAGYTARVVPTATPDVFWGVWVNGDNPTQQIEAQFFTK